MYCDKYPCIVPSYTRRRCLCSRYIGRMNTYPERRQQAHHIIHCTQTREYKQQHAADKDGLEDCVVSHLQGRQSALTRGVRNVVRAASEHTGNHSACGSCSLQRQCSHVWMSITNPDPALNTTVPILVLVHLSYSRHGYPGTC
jgi:hypothetical protein